MEPGNETSVLVRDLSDDDHDHDEDDQEVLDKTQVQDLEASGLVNLEKSLLSSTLDEVENDDDEELEREEQVKEAWLQQAKETESWEKRVQEQYEDEQAEAAQELDVIDEAEQDSQVEPMPKEEAQDSIQVEKSSPLGPVVAEESNAAISNAEELVKDVSSASSDFELVDKLTTPVSQTSPVIVNVKELEVPSRPQPLDVGKAPAAPMHGPYTRLGSKEMARSQQARLREDAAYLRQLFEYKQRKFEAEQIQEAYERAIVKTQIQQRIQQDRARQLSRDMTFKARMLTAIAEFEVQQQRRAAELSQENAKVKARIAEMDARRREKEASRKTLLKLLF